MLVSIVMGASSYICGLFTGCISTYVYMNYNNIYEKAQEDAIVLGYKTMQLFTIIKENAAVKRIVKLCQWIYVTLIHYIYHTAIEPPGAFWIYSCSLARKQVPLYSSLNGKEFNNYINKYTLIEKYNEVTENNMNEPFENYKSLLLHDADLVIVKVEDHYIIRRPENIVSVDIKKSKYGFLSVEYLHPNQKEPIVLNINKNMCMEGNELFTHEFVLRTLIYQNVDCYFDLAYKIRIMDNNINMFELNSNQYIELTEKSYIVHEYHAESQKE